MGPLRSLIVGFFSLLGFGCASRSYQDNNLLDPYHFNGTTLTVYASRESGQRRDAGSSFNPNGPNAVTTVERSDLHRIDFRVEGTTATLAGSQHLLGLDARPMASAITTSAGYLDQTPPPAYNVRESQLLAPLGNAYLVSDGKHYTIYADTKRETVLDSGDYPGPKTTHFNWAGDRIYTIDSDPDGIINRIQTTRVGSGGVWEEIVYDANKTPVDDRPGETYVEAYDLIDNEIVLLLHKHYAARADNPYEKSTYGLLRGSRLITTWQGDPPGFIRPDLRALVGWHRRYNNLKATLSLRSLDDGTERLIPIDATKGLR